MHVLYTKRVKDPLLMHRSSSAPLSRSGLWEAVIMTPTSQKVPWRNPTIKRGLWNPQEMKVSILKTSNVYMGHIRFIWGLFLIISFLLAKSHFSSSEFGRNPMFVDWIHADLLWDTNVWLWAETLKPRILCTIYSCPMCIPKQGILGLNPPPWLDHINTAVQTH